MSMGGPEKWQRSIDSENWHRPIEIEPEKWERPRESVKKWNAFSRTCSQRDQSQQRGQVVRQAVYTAGVRSTGDMPLQERKTRYVVLVTVEMVNSIQNQESLLEFWENHRSYLHDNSDGISNKGIVFSRLFSKAAHIYKHESEGSSESPIVEDKLISLLSSELRWLLTSDPSFLSLRCVSYLARSLSFIVFSCAEQKGSDAVNELAGLVFRWLNVILKASDFVDRLKEDQMIGRRIGLFLQSVGTLGKVYSVEDFRHEIGLLQSDLVEVDIQTLSLESINDCIRGLFSLSKCKFSIDDRVIDYLQLALMQVDTNKVHTCGVFTNVVYGLRGFSGSGYLFFKKLVTHLMTMLKMLEGSLFSDKAHCEKLNSILMGLKKKDGPFDSKLQWAAVSINSRSIEKSQKMSASGRFDAVLTPQREAKNKPSTTTVNSALQRGLSCDELNWLDVLRHKCQIKKPDILEKLLAAPRDKDSEEYPVSTIIHILEVLTKLDEHNNISDRMSDRLQSVLLANAKQGRKFSGGELGSIADSLDSLFDLEIAINEELLKCLQKR